MTEAELRDRVKEWDLTDFSEEPDSASKYQQILDRLDFFGRGERSRYLPANHPDSDPSFLGRLASWIGNVDTAEDQKLLLEYALYIGFFSHEDFCALYAAAFRGPIARWVIDDSGISLRTATFQEQLQHELFQRTWYCPITDSLDINEFYHCNHISGIKHRPGFLTLSALDRRPSKRNTKSRLIRNLDEYINNPDSRSKAPPLKRLVLLEDFVGTGTQSKAAVEWAAQNLSIPILFVPLIICQKGARELARLVALYPKLRIEPIIHLQERDLLGPERAAESEWSICEDIEGIAEREFDKVAGRKNSPEDKPPFTAFGFKQTGCSVVTYSNTPNNSLPLIHHHSANSSWKPLFPRTSRL